MVGFSFYFRWVKAASFSLYPESCLGSWQNPHLAQGRLNTDNTEQEINKNNAAVFSEGGVKEIYCGGFNGDLSENEIKLIKSVNLKFSWLVSDEELKIATSSEAVAKNTNDVISQILDNIHTDEIQVTVSTTTSEITIITNNARQATTSIPEIESAPILENTAAIGNNVATQETSTSSPTSFWWKKYRFFSAEDNVSNVQTIPTESVAAATSSLESHIAPVEDFLKVSYTLDGKNWQALGMVNKNNWQNLAFEIPVYQLEDVKKIQIKIESLPILNKTPFVYLGGLALQVEYETSLTSQPKTISILSQQSNFVSYNSYSRTPNGSSITGPVSINVSVDSFDDFGFNNGCGLNSQPCDFWGVRVTDFDNKSFNSKCVSNETLSHTFIFDLPAESYIEIMAYAGHTQESCERGGEMSKFLEGNSSEKIFTVMGQ